LNERRGASFVRFHAHSDGLWPVILALVAVQSGFFAVASSARGAIVPRIVPIEMVPAANTINFTVSNVGQVIGPLIAGFLVTRHDGFRYAYGLDTVLFTLALYAAMRLPKMPPEGHSPPAGLRSVLEGFAFIAGRPVLLMSFLVDIVAMVFAMPRALFPQVAADRWHGQVGPLYAALAIGAVLAGVSSGWIGRVRRQGVTLTFAIVLWGVCVAAAGLMHSLLLAVVFLAFAGAADLVSAVYRQTILQTYAPDQMRGRMQGVFVVVVAGGPRLGDLRAGATETKTVDGHQLIREYADASNLQYEESSFDRLVATCLLIHLAEPEVAFPDYVAAMKGYFKEPLSSEATGY